MDIEITEPINLALDVIEIDEHVPSMKFNALIKIKKFGYSLVLNKEFWLECQCIDVFINNLNNGRSATLKDMNGCFELRLDPASKEMEWLCAKEDLDGYVTMTKGREKLTDSAKTAIQTAFNNYPRWW